MCFEIITDIDYLLLLMDHNARRKISHVQILNNK
jgi:hypothetical protein